jgi:hypothetical protein
MAYVEPDFNHGKKHASVAQAECPLKIPWFSRDQMTLCENPTEIPLKVFDFL